MEPKHVFSNLYSIQRVDYVQRQYSSVLRVQRFVVITLYHQNATSAMHSVIKPKRIAFYFILYSMSLYWWRRTYTNQYAYTVWFNFYLYSHLGSCKWWIVSGIHLYACVYMYVSLWEWNEKKKCWKSQETTDKNTQKSIRNAIHHPIKSRTRLEESHTTKTIGERKNQIKSNKWKSFCRLRRKTNRIQINCQAKTVCPLIWVCVFNSDFRFWARVK